MSNFDHTPRHDSMSTFPKMSEPIPRRRQSSSVYEPGSDIHVHHSSVSESETSSSIQNTSKIACNKDIAIFPFQFFFTFGMVTSVVMGNDVLMFKSCTVVFNYTVQICSNLTEHPTKFNNIEKVAKQYTMYVTLLTCIPSVVVSFFVGGWSDKYGRKIPIIIAILGVLVQDVGSVLNVIYMEWPLDYVLLAVIPSCIVGGLAVISTCTFCLVSDKFPPESRTMMYGFLEVSNVSGYLCATFLGGQVYKYFGYPAVYFMALTSHSLAFLLATFFIKDTVRVLEPSFKDMIKDFFSLKSLKNNLQVYTKTREGNHRLQLSLLTVSLGFVFISYLTPIGVLIFYCKKMYSWNVTTYTNAFTGMFLLSVLVAAIATPTMTKLFGLRDSILGLVGSLSLIGENLIFGLSFEPWIFYLAFAVGSFIHLTPFAIRSQLSKLVKADEFGKLFAVSAACEYVAPVFENFLSTPIYNSTIDVFPGAIFLVMSLLMAFPFSVFMWILCVQRRTIRHSIKHIDSAESTIGLQI